MKKSLFKMVSVVMMLAMVLCLGACGAKDGGGETKAETKKTEETKPDATAKLDLESTEVQAITDDRAEYDTLKETVDEWLDGNTMFTPDTEMGKYTYKDFVEHIGCDASEYKYDEDNKAECYTWKAKDNETKMLSVWFQDGKLAFTGAVL